MGLHAPKKAHSLNKRNGPRLECRFYLTAGGAEPVREWLLALGPGIRKEIGSDIKAVQWRWPVGMPLVDGLGGGLYEVRSTMEGNEFRVFFCVREGTMFLLHGIVKKTRQTSGHALELARRRQRDLEEGR